MDSPIQFRSRLAARFPKLVESAEQALNAYAANEEPDDANREALEALELLASDGRLDSEDGLLRRRMFVAALALLTCHVSNDASYRPEVVRHVVRLLGGHAENGLLSPAALDKNGVIEDLLREISGAALAGEPVGGTGNGDDYGFHNLIIPNESSRA